MNTFKNKIKNDKIKYLKYGNWFYVQKIFFLKFPVIFVYKKMNLINKNKFKNVILFLFLYIVNKQNIFLFIYIYIHT